MGVDVHSGGFIVHDCLWRLTDQRCSDSTLELEFAIIAIRDEG